MRTKLGIRSDAGPWASCNFKVNHMFQGDWMKDYQTQIPDLLAHGIRVLIYAGDQDFICNVRPRRVTRVECTPCARPERYARC